MTVICAIQLVRWAARWHIFDALVGASWKPAHEHCTGTDCYEVFTCHGMREATQHVREPLSSSTGIVLFPLGAYATHHGYRRPLVIVGIYLAISALIHAGLIVADAAYWSTCDAYTSNMMLQTLLNDILPPSPFTPAAKRQLRQMVSYPRDTVDQVTGGFPSLTWYIIWAGLWTALLAYAAREAHLLGDLLERGPLGLGVHYGLDQWDQVISHDAVRRHKEREMRSQFIDDARLPVTAEAPASLGHRAVTSWQAYGSTGNA